MAKETKLLSRFAAAQTRKLPWDDIYREVLTYTTWYRETFFEKRSVGDRRHRTDIVFDSTGQFSVLRAASNIMAMLMPSGRHWRKLVPGSQVDKATNPSMEKDLEAVEKVIYEGLASSNFEAQMSDSLTDLMAGTGALLANKGTKENPYIFTAVPLSEVFLEEGVRGTVETVFRKHTVLGRNIFKQWPDAKLTRTLRESLESKPDQEVILIEATVPKEINGQEPTNPSLFRYVVMLENGEAIVEREMRSSPWIVFRGFTFPGEIYGTGPALVALPDIKTLNKTTELTLKSASLDAYPSYTVVDDGVLSIANMRVEPGGMIPVSSNVGGLGGPTISILPRSGNFDVGQLIIANMQKAIEKVMFLDTLGPIDQPVRTATEVSIRDRNDFRLQVGFLGRLNFELVDKLFSRLLHIQQELGNIDLPEEFLKDGRIVNIKHVSPIDAARDQEELLKIRQYLEFMQPLTGPALASVVPIGTLSRRIGAALQIPQELLLTETEGKAADVALQAAAAGQPQGAPQ